MEVHVHQQEEEEEHVDVMAVALDIHLFDSLVDVVTESDVHDEKSILGEEGVHGDTRQVEVDNPNENLREELVVEVEGEDQNDTHVGKVEQLVVVVPRAYSRVFGEGNDELDAHFAKKKKK